MMVLPEKWPVIGGAKPPETIEAALERVAGLRVPYRIKVWINREFPEIVGHEYLS